VIDLPQFLDTGTIGSSTHEHNMAHPRRKPLICIAKAFSHAKPLPLPCCGLN
jgi:hypothetical protein